jgi:hypothetical protein
MDREVLGLRRNWEILGLRFQGTSDIFSVESYNGNQNADSLWLRTPRVNQLYALLASYLNERTKADFEPCHANKHVHLVQLPIHSPDTSLNYLLDWGKDCFGVGGYQCF